MRSLGIIPARGGSKGVPRKNVRLVAGKPLIAYAVQAAEQSRRLTSFLTTTDDDEIAEISARWGSPVLRRPADLAQDGTAMVPVLVHALEAAEQKANASFDAIILLQPTSPFRRGEDVDSVIEILETDLEIDSVVSVCEMDDTHPARMYWMDAKGYLDSLLPEWETARRQDVPLVYYRNGALYACRRKLLVERQLIMGDRKKAYVMPRAWLANIDDERDLVIADALAPFWQEGKL